MTINKIHKKSLLVRSTDWEKIILIQDGGSIKWQKKAYSAQRKKMNPRLAVVLQTHLFSR